MRLNQSRAAINGATLEQDLAAAHLRMRAAGWFMLRQHPESNGKQVIGKGAPDFFGVNLRRFRAVLFDAKSTAGKRWPVSLLRPHQLAYLRAFHEAGGTAGIYLRTSEGDAWIGFVTLATAWDAYWHGQKEQYLCRDDGVVVENCEWGAVL